MIILLYHRIARLQHDPWGIAVTPERFEKQLRFLKWFFRPVPLPTLLEAAPADILRWTEDRALIGTGSPFAPVETDGRTIRISQTNNSYIFPGLALGILVARARREF